MRAEATSNLYPQVVNWDEKYGSFDKDGNKVTINEAKVDDEVKKLKAEYDAKKYQRDRQPEYPNIGDQLDALYHAGVFPKEMADKLKAVKDKYPKPE